MPSPLVPMLAKVNFNDPLFWAVLIGWILTVVLHELAHGIVGYLGGDYTIRERGGLTLNPLQYVDPVNSIALPALFLLMGGIPLPGAVTYIRRDLLRSRAWETNVSLAGPAMNFLLFALLLLPMHPSIGWLHPSPTGVNWTPAERFLATLATLQFLSGVFNLIPAPSLDGFGAIRPYLPRETRAAIDASPFRRAGLFVVIAIFWVCPQLIQQIYRCQDQVLTWMGMGDLNYAIGHAFNGVIAQ